MGADLQVLWEVVEENDLQQQLLSSDNAGRKIQGQEEILKDCELQEEHMSHVYITSQIFLHLLIQEAKSHSDLSGQKKV